MPIARVIHGWIKPDGSLLLVGQNAAHDRAAFKEFDGFRYKSQALAKAREDGWIRVRDNAIELPRPDDALLIRARNYVLDNPSVQEMCHIIIEWKSKNGPVSFLVPWEEFVELSHIGELYSYRRSRWV